MKLVVTYEYVRRHNDDICIERTPSMVLDVFDDIKFQLNTKNYSVTGKIKQSDELVIYDKKYKIMDPYVYGILFNMTKSNYLQDRVDFEIAAQKLMSGLIKFIEKINNKEIYLFNSELI